MQTKSPYWRPQLTKTALNTDIRPALTAEDLAKTWGVSWNTAEKTIKVMTQRGIRTVLHPTLLRRLRTNDRQLQYRRLPIDLFTDTMKALVKSRRGNQYAQVFGARNQWARTKGEAHDGLSLLFARDGVLNTIIGDSSKEQMLGTSGGSARRHCVT